MINCLLVLTTIIPYCKPYFPTCKDKTKSLLPQISSSFFALSFFIFTLSFFFLLPHVSSSVIKSSIFACINALRNNDL